MLKSVSSACTEADQYSDRLNTELVQLLVEAAPFYTHIYAAVTVNNQQNDE
jgi:hypothetical protein